MSLQYETKKMKVDEIRTVLHTKFGLTKEETKTIIGKTNLTNRLEYEINHVAGKNMDEDDNLPDLENVELVKDTNTNIDNTPPSQDDPGWTKYVLSLLTKEEKIKGNPTVDGLRRIIGQLIGEIISINSEVLQVPTPENEKRATVKVNVCLESSLFEGVQLEASGCADSYIGNTDQKYQTHPVAIAETRAEGRALKRLLRLRKVISAEEQTDSVDEYTLDTVGKITQPQLTYLELVCRDKLGINIKKLVNKHFPDVKNLGNISHLDALELLKTLSSYQSTGVPDDIAGYDTNWKQDLNLM